MENKEIIKRASILRTKKDLLHLLNDLLKDELGESCGFRFSMKQLSYFSNPNNIKGRYKNFFIPKKSGGKRSISAPRENLGYILHYVNTILKAIYQPSKYAMGYCKGRSVVSNASHHIGQNYIFNIDLENFFPSIDQARVWKRLQMSPFNFPHTIANILAGLCSIYNKEDDKTIKYVLPQGAPTSPILSNAICDNLDKKLAGVARRFGLHYSRYADDITFSSMHNVYHVDGDFMKELQRIIKEQNFKINNEKIRLQKVGQHQEVTGLTVSSRVNTPKKYVAEIRNILHIWERYGYNDVYKRFYNHYVANKGHIKKGVPLLENVLYGKLQYLKMVKGGNDSVYVALQNRYNKLASPINIDKKEALDYLYVFTLKEFEEIIGSKIEYVLSKNNKIYGRVMLNDKYIIIHICREEKKYILNHNIISNDLVDENIKKDSLKSKETLSLPINLFSTKDLYVAQVSKNGHAPFWLIIRGPLMNDNLFSNCVNISEVLDIWEEEGIDSAVQKRIEYLVKRRIELSLNSQTS